MCYRYSFCVLSFQHDGLLWSHFVYILYGLPTIMCYMKSFCVFMTTNNEVLYDVYVAILYFLSIYYQEWSAFINFD